MKKLKRLWEVLIFWGAMVTLTLFVVVVLIANGLGLITFVAAWVSLLLVFLFLSKFNDWM
jgi:hypothetical protein